MMSSGRLVLVGLVSTFLVFCMLSSFVESRSVIPVSEQQQQQTPPSEKFSKEESKRIAEKFMTESHFAQWLPKIPAPSHEQLPKLKKSPAGAAPPTQPLTPVVIVPSFFGNTIYATLKHAHPSHWYCRDNSKQYVLFFDEFRFIPPFLNCWMQDMLITYNNHTYGAPQGVIIDAEHDYGNTTTLEWIDPQHTYGIWNATVAALVGVGYERGVTVRGAPADWRLGANGWVPFWARLKTLIEETSAANGNLPVAVVSLSMGSPYFLNFLNTVVDQDWKDQYIHSFTSMSGVFGGSSAAIPALLGGDNGFVPPTVNYADYDALARSIGAVAYLLPTEQTFGNTTLITTPEGNFTAADFDELLLAVGANNTAQMLVDMDQYRSFQAPGVELHCIVGYNISTIASVIYPDGLGSAMNTTYADGDGVVLSRSLDICDQWNTSQSQPINTIRIPNVQHGDPVFLPEVIQYFISTVLGIPTTLDNEL